MNHHLFYRMHFIACRFGKFNQCSVKHITSHSVHQFEVRLLTPYIPHLISHVLTEYKHSLFQILLFLFVPFFIYLPLFPYHVHHKKLSLFTGCSWSHPDVCAICCPSVKSHFLSPSFYSWLCHTDLIFHWRLLGNYFWHVKFFW